MLLDVIAAVRETVPDLRLVKVGGEWTARQSEQIDRLGPWPSAITPRMRADPARASRSFSAGRRSVLMPSEAEGFGLPVIEALACGAAVVASDIPGPARSRRPGRVIYVPVGDVGAWADTVAKLLADPAAAPPRAERLAWAGRFTWAAHAEIIARAYHRLLRN